MGKVKSPIGDLGANGLGSHLNGMQEICWKEAGEAFAAGIGDENLAKIGGHQDFHQAVESALVQFVKNIIEDQ